ncbi:hypothetical protein SPRG_18314, partial [Saprolegnia parasitica CBS 223.65]
MLGTTSLVELCATQAADSCAVDEIAAAVTWLPTEAIERVWAHMSAKKLRELELALPSACPDDTAALLDALQAQWRERIRRDVRSLNHKLDSSKYFANASEATT